MSEETQQAQQPSLPPIKLAFILDGEVVDILHTDERLSAIFTSNPLILDVSNSWSESNELIRVGSKYNYETKEFFVQEPEIVEG